MTDVDAIDPYSGMAEFHDLFMDGAWERLRPVMAAAFGKLGEDAVLVDIGAGTGVGTCVVARATSAQIVAVEPSSMMRAVLIARVADDPDLSRRVTVLAGTAPDVFDHLGDRIDGFVCAHVLGHLSPDDRSRLWATLSDRLGADPIGVVVVNPDPGESTSDGGDRSPEERRIGRHRFVEQHLPTGPGRYESEYTVYDGDQVVRVERFAGEWTAITVSDLAAELTDHGFTVERQGAGVGLVRRAR